MSDPIVYKDTPLGDYFEGIFPFLSSFPLPISVQSLVALSLEHCALLEDTDFRNGYVRD